MNTTWLPDYIELYRYQNDDSKLHNLIYGYNSKDDRWYFYTESAEKTAEALMKSGVEGKAASHDSLISKSTRVYL